MKIFFEYFYFRFAQRHFKKEGTGAATAILAISSVQFWWIFNIIIFIEYSIDNSQVRKLYSYEKFLIFALFLGLFFFNQRLYSKRYLEFRERWKDENETVRGRNWFILILVLVVSWFLIFLNGWIFDRFINYG